MVRPSAAFCGDIRFVISPVGDEISGVEIIQLDPRSSVSQSAADFCVDHHLAFAPGSSLWSDGFDRGTFGALGI